MLLGQMAAEERCLYVQKTKKGLTGARRVCRRRRNVAKRGRRRRWILMPGRRASEERCIKCFKRLRRV